MKLEIKPSTIRLSEAIMLGAEFGPPVNTWCGCLMGQASRAMGYDNTSCRNNEDGRVEFLSDRQMAMGMLWPWVLDTMTEMPDVIQSAYPHSYRERVLSIISMFADAVRVGRCTREQATDWVRSIEPEPPTEQELTTEPAESPVAVG